MPVTLQQRIAQLETAAKGLEKRLSAIAEAGTLRAVEAAADATPPKRGEGRGPYIGTNTLSGELKAHWATDSVTKPQKTGDGYETQLANQMQYASYVNDGHRMDRHFVPGLFVNPDSGLLEYQQGAEVGIVVGTKTAYVKGEFMTEKGKEAYEKTVQQEAEALTREVFR